jgi:ubiquinone/menaquinone biosynthesis C-methylase UbiE
MKKRAEVIECYDAWHNKRSDESSHPSISMLEHMGMREGQKLLDIGCGAGYFLREAEKKGLQTFGIDGSRVAVNMARKVAKDSKIVLGYIEDLPFEDNYFDYVTAWGVLEHVVDIDKVINEMIRVSKGNSQFCILVPNSNYVLLRLFGFSLKNIWETKQPLEKLYSLEEWQRVLTRNGLCIDAVLQDKHESAPPKGKVHQVFWKVTRRMIWPFMPLVLTESFVFLCHNGKGDREAMA